MQFKFRPTVEALDSRDLPSGSPLDPPTDPPAFTLDDSQLDTMLADGELTTGELETLLGVDLDGSDSPNPADPQPPAPQPGQPPVVKPPFTPVPPLTDPVVAAVPPPNLDFTNVQGGIAGNSDEIAEATKLKQQIAAIDIALDRIGDQLLALGTRRADLETLRKSLVKKVADLTTTVTLCQQNLDNYTGDNQVVLGNLRAEL